MYATISRVRSSGVSQQLAVSSMSTGLARAITSLILVPAEMTAGRGRCRAGPNGGSIVRSRLAPALPTVMRFNDVIVPPPPPPPCSAHPYLPIQFWQIASFKVVNLA